LKCWRISSRARVLNSLVARSYLTMRSFRKNA